MKNKFHQISKEIILNYVVKNTSFREKCKLIASYCFIDDGLQMLYSEQATQIVL